MLYYLWSPMILRVIVINSYLSTEVVISCQVLEPEQTVPRASATTTRVLMDHLHTQTSQS